MSETKNFQFAILLSIFLHFVFIIGVSEAPFLEPIKHSIKQPIRIAYYKIKEQKLVGIKPESLPRFPEIEKKEILEQKKALQKIGEKISEKPKGEDETMQTAEQGENKKFETAVMEEKDNIKKEVYLNYYRLVRERIKTSANNNYPREGAVGVGEVFVTFTVASSGELLQVAIINERSVDNTVLRRIAMNSVRDASPFPPFPDVIIHPQITFSVIICFEGK